MQILRFLLLAGFAALLSIVVIAPAGAQPVSMRVAWEYRQCPADSAAALPARFDGSECEDVVLEDIDPQNRHIWLQTVIDSDNLPETGPLAVLISAMASSEVYWNGHLLGRNGMPGVDRATEIAGRMDAEFYLPPDLINAGENLLAVRMSSHDGWIHARRPVHVIGVAAHRTAAESFLRYYLPTLIAAGALLVAIGYFATSYAYDRRNTANLLLSLLAGFALVQAWAESSRVFFDYDYPLHVPRLILVGIMSWCIAVTLTALVTVRFKVLYARYYIAATAGLGLLIAPFMPGFDGKSLMALLIGLAVSSIALARPAWRGDWAARITALALLVFIGLLFYRNAGLLDRDLFLAITALCGVLFVDQILAMRRVRRARDEADRRSSRLELELVRRGIAPHFLMNTLNSLAEWVESDPETGVRMIHALGEQMRDLAGISDRDLIPLSQELGLVQSYLTVMSFRTDTPFRLDVTEHPAGINIPPGVLHTLAENAFSHNRFPEGGTFTLSVESVGADTRLVFETPPARSRRHKQGSGQGHAYVRGRLANAFGDRADFQAYGTDQGTWRSLIDMPGTS